LLPTPASGPDAAASARALYLDLMKRAVTNAIYDPGAVIQSTRPLQHRGWPKVAHSMLGFDRLDNIQRCIESVLKDQIAGDLLEAGVWRGGATILMRAVLKAYGVRDRLVWVADSFAGLPPPDAAYPADAESTLHERSELAVPLEEVAENFRRYDLLDDQVRFLKGWFSETLPGAPIERLAVLRLDGDMYESTMDTLSHLYGKLSVGGYLIVDDYGVVPGCKAAVHDFRDRRRIKEPIVEVDWTAVYWRKLEPGTP
jgi:O-methyltransferase